MPIRREYRWFYPIDWPQLWLRSGLTVRRGGASIAVARMATWSFTLGMVAGGTEKRLLGGTVGAGRSHCGRNRPPKGMTGSFRPEVVLATTHLDHNPSNNKTRNLKAYCQRCHMLHDRDEHRRRRQIAFRKKNALGDLFLGPYSN